MSKIRKFRAAGQISHQQTRTELMAVDLSTNSHALKEAYNAVVQGQATNWAIFGYQGKTNTLKLVETGGQSVVVALLCSLEQKAVSMKLLKSSVDHMCSTASFA